MAFWRRFFSKPERQDKPLTALGRMTSDRVEALAREIFLHHKSALLAEPAAHAVPASPGSSRLSVTQQEILRKIGPASVQIITSLDFTHLTQAQEYAVAHLVKSLIVARIACMVEASRNVEKEKLRAEGSQGHPLCDMEPMGNA